MKCNPKRGKIIILIIICTMLLLDATSTALVTFKFGLYKLPHGIIRFLVTSTFTYYIYKGKRWAKNLFVGTLLAAVLSLLMNSDKSILLNPFIIFMLSVFSISGILLMFSKDVRYHFEDKAYENTNASSTGEQI